MNKKYPSIIKLVVAGGLGLFALLIPFVAVKILLAIAGIVVIALSLKKFKWLLITLGVMFLVIPVVALTVINGIGSSFLNWPLGFIDSPSILQWFNWIENDGYEYYGDNESRYVRKNSNHKTYMPDKYVDGAKEIIVKGLGFEISFDENSDRIFIPSELNVKSYGGKLEISMPNDMENSTAHITVGTLSKIERLEFDTVFLRLSDRVNVDDMRIETTSGEINGEVLASKAISIEGTSLSITGTLRAPEITIERATSLSFVGSVEAEKFSVQNGVSLAFSMEASKIENLSIHGTVVNGRIKFSDSWIGSRHVNVSGIGGSLNLMMPTDSGGFELITSGRVSVVTEKY
ncbi:hypothetical protein [Mesotoga sp. BH458_6_3_2_1]|uniref:hypothetical protein n=1 Tax=Mesotoga sp. BH458_6_3_2_1 TaxID=1437446 RepID=UPI000EF176CF|nr:hypothetical protein [Mesotoga sp. BH458_6_3_2_1]RLL85073.1 hypothetical protein Y697_11730 [Mesotoga sp. BH458_6_3_2_1]